MTETPQERGRLFERWLSRRLKMRPVPQSGAGVYKLDVGERSLIVSAKHTDAESFRITREMLEEMVAAVVGIGGIGADSTSVLAIEIGGISRWGFYIDGEDLIKLLEQDVRLVPPTKDAQRRARASTPSLLRDD